MNDPCPSADVLRRLAENDLADADWTEVADHVDHCADCRAKIAVGVSQSAGPYSAETPFELAEAVRQPNLDVAPEPSETIAVPGYAEIEWIGKEDAWRCYRALREGTGTRIKLRILARTSETSSDPAKRLVPDASRVVGLSHPHLIEIRELGMADERPFVVEEDVDAPSLAGAIGPGLPIRRAIEITASVASALHVAHCKGIVHCDLSAARVMLVAEDPSGDRTIPKIRPVELHQLVTGPAARAKRSPTAYWPRRGLVSGALGYKAPEQVLVQEEHFGPGIDVYALGCLLYETLTGRPPFVGAVAAEVLQMTAHSQPSSPKSLRPDVPARLERVCLRCLEKRPADRYPSAQALADELRSLLSSVEPGGEARKARARRRGALAACALTALLLILGVVPALRFGTSVPEKQGDQPQEKAEYEIALDRIRQLEVLAQKSDALSRRNAASELSRALDQSIPAIVRWAQSRPGDARSALLCGDAHRRIGVVAELLGRRDIGLTSLNESKRWLLKVSMNEASSVDLRARAAAAWFQLGETQLRYKESASALQAFDRSLDGYAMLHREEPANVDHLIRIAAGQGRAAAALLDLNEQVRARHRLGREHDELLAARELAPTNERTRFALAINLLRFGKLARTNGDAAVAVSRLEAARKLWNEPATADAVYPASATETLLELGLARVGQRKHQEAQTCFGEALDLLKRSADNARLRALRADLLQAQGAHLSQSWSKTEPSTKKLDRIKRAEKALRRAHQLRVELQKTLPVSEQRRIALVEALVLRSRCARELSKLNEAERLLKDALRELQSVIQSSGKDKKILAQRTRLLHERARMLETLGDHDEAVKVWSELIELSNGKNVHQIAYRAWLLAQTARYQQAVAVAEGILQEAKHDVFRWASARVFAAAALAVQNDAKLDAGAKAELSLRYAAMAIGVLEDISKRDYFKQYPSHSQELLSEAPWTVLRQQKAYRALLAKLN